MDYTEFDMVFKMNGYVLVNEKYEDDEGFFKNCFQWGPEGGKLECLKGLKSNSYSSESEAIKIFKKIISG